MHTDQIAQEVLKILDARDTKLHDEIVSVVGAIKENSTRSSDAADKLTKELRDVSKAIMELTYEQKELRALMTTLEAHSFKRIEDIEKEIDKLVEVVRPLEGANRNISELWTQLNQLKEDVNQFKVNKAAGDAKQDVLLTNQINKSRATSDNVWKIITGVTTAIAIAVLAKVYGKA